MRSRGELRIDYRITLLRDEAEGKPIPEWAAHRNVFSACSSASLRLRVRFGSRLTQSLASD